MYSTKYSALFYLAAAVASTTYLVLRTYPTPTNRGIIFKALILILIATITDKALPYSTGPLEFLRKWNRLYIREDRERERRHQHNELDQKDNANVEASVNNFQGFDRELEEERLMGFVISQKWALSLRSKYFAFLGAHLVCLGVVAELVCKLGWMGDTSSTIGIWDRFPRWDGSDIDDVTMVRLWITHFSLAFLTVGIIEPLRQNRKYIQPCGIADLTARINTGKCSLRSFRWHLSLAYPMYSSWVIFYFLFILLDIIMGYTISPFSSGTLDAQVGLGRAALDLILTHKGLPELSRILNLSSLWSIDTTVILPWVCIVMMDLTEKIFYFLNKPILPGRFFEPKTEYDISHIYPAKEGEPKLYSHRKHLLIAPGEEWQMWWNAVPVLRLTGVYYFPATLLQGLSAWARSA